jgi:hypothetical protein
VSAEASELRGDHGEELRGGGGSRRATGATPGEICEQEQEDFGLVGLNRKTEVKNRNRTRRFCIFEITDWVFILQNRNLLKPNKPNRSFGINRMPRLTFGYTRALL